MVYSNYGRILPNNIDIEYVKRSNMYVLNFSYKDYTNSLFIFFNSDIQETLLMNEKNIQNKLIHISLDRCFYTEEIMIPLSSSIRSQTKGLVVYDPTDYDNEFYKLNKEHLYIQEFNEC